MLIYIIIIITRPGHNNKRAVLGRGTRKKTDLIEYRYESRNAVRCRAARIVNCHGRQS